MSLLSHSSLELDNWQAGKKSIREKNKYMFNNWTMSDVKFVVGKELQESIPAHKYVLAISSAVFQKMFYGEESDQRDYISRCTIELPDCELSSLMEFLRFIYCDELRLTTSCVLGTSYLGKRYGIPLLVDVCQQFLEKNVSVPGIFKVLVQARQFGDSELEKRCWKLIDRETTSALESEGFLDIPHETLKALLQRDALNIREVDLFKAVERWAERRCDENGLEHEGCTKRNFIAEALNLIRFPTMTQEEFALVVLPTEILKKQDALDIFKKFSSLNIPIPYSDRPRGRVLEVMRCCRFETTGNGWGYSGSSVDGVSFMADTSVCICGIRLYGNLSHSYKVSVEIRSSSNKILEITPPRSFTSSSGGKFGHVGFDVFFDAPVRISSNKTYHIRIKMDGNASSFYGQNGVAEVKGGGVKFTFSSYTGSNNGTGVTQGQIPEILFYKSSVGVQYFDF